MAPQIPSIIGRLLEELSWTGRLITNYRGGGRGYENVLSAEVLQALDFLPRGDFFGSIVEGLHDGNAETRAALRHGAEEANFLVLPGEMHLHGDAIPKVEVQPDAIITTGEIYCLVEAKRIRSSQFQSRQLAREFVMAHRLAAGRRPMLLLIISNPPPVKVQKRGKISIREAIIAALPEVFDLGTDLDRWVGLIDETIFWITWDELASLIRTAAGPFDSGSQSVNASIKRLADSVLQSIQWHGKEEPFTDKRKNRTNLNVLT